MKLLLIGRGVWLLPTDMDRDSSTQKGNDGVLSGYEIRGFKVKYIYIFVMVSYSAEIDMDLKQIRSAHLVSPNLVTIHD